MINLIPHLSSLGFENNGRFSMDLGSVLELKSNSDQNNDIFVDDTSIVYSQIVTLVEQGPNSGIFESFDSNDQSTIGITKSAPRGKTGIISYNEDSISILTGSSTASVSLQKPELKLESNSKSLSPGTKYSIILADSDQNINTGSQEHLDVFRDSSLIPALKIGNPVTLGKSSSVIFYPDSTNFLGDENALSSVPDKNSARLFIDTITSPFIGTIFKQFSLNLGITVSDLQSVLIDVNNSSNIGTNWINYDFRSLENDFEVKDFSDTKIDLYFGSFPSSSSLRIVNPGDIFTSSGFIQLDDDTVENIFKETGPVFLVINFGSSGVMTISNESDLQPIIFDFFSFGLDSQLNGINNSIYRFELEETSDNSSIFEGTFEYAIANQLNLLDVNFIKKINTIDDDVKFLLTDRLVDEDAIFISYSDLDKVGLIISTSTGSSLTTHSGVVSTNSNSYRFGQPVVIILNDSDLNLKSDRIDIYHVIDDLVSPNVDTIGRNGVKMLEILIKDVRYKRCTINGVEHGGLASTGFSLIETGPSTGIFEGVFKMPSQICNKAGTELISSAGGSLDIKYYDSRDNFGNANIFSLLRDKSTFYNPPQLSIYEIVKPLTGKIQEITLSGSIDNHRRGVPLSVTIISPDGKSQNFGSILSNSGGYRSIISINENSLPGQYEIKLSHNNSHVGTISFVVLNPEIPEWIKNNSKQWSSTLISDSELIDGIENLIEEGLIIQPNERNSISEQIIPEWIKNNAKWWIGNQISDEDFVKSIQYLIKKGIIRI